MKKYLAIALAVMLVATFAAGALAGKSGGAGNSNTGHLYFVMKDPVGWSVVDTTWGKMKYNLSGPMLNFVFNGHGLDPTTPYSLIYYPEPRTVGVWPWGVTVLAQGTSNRGGNIHLSDSWDPQEDFEYVDGDYMTGAKIWLVLSADINAAEQLEGWNPGEYLFEWVPISFDDTDVS